MSRGGRGKGRKRRQVKSKETRKQKKKKKWGTGSWWHLCIVAIDRGDDFLLTYDQ